MKDFLNRLMRLLEGANVIRKTYKNWIRIGLKLKSSKFPITAINRRGIKVNITGYDKVISDYLMVQYNVIFNHNKEFTDPFAVFLFNEYGYISRCRNIKVLDIGANIGDSSIYFIVNRASQVIAVEPYPVNFLKLVENIKNNGLENKIIAVNGVLGSKQGDIKIDINREVSSGSDIVESVGGYNIRELTLQDLILLYNLNDAYLKMDCEGCEYKSIMTASRETLRAFSRMQIEYHYGYDNLVF